MPEAAREVFRNIFKAWQRQMAIKIMHFDSRRHYVMTRRRHKGDIIIMAAFQNVSIPSLYAVLLLYTNYVDMQSYQTMHQL